MTFVLHDVIVATPPQVVLDRCGPYFSLSVPGLSEGRPSLLVGDKIIVCDHGNKAVVIFAPLLIRFCVLSDEDVLGTHWEGYIHEVLKGVMLMLLHHACKCMDIVS